MSIKIITNLYSDQIRSVTQLCPTLCDLMNRSTPGLPVHHQLPEFTQTRVHWVCDAIQPSHPLSSPSPLAPNPSQYNVSGILKLWNLLTLALCHHITLWKELYCNIGAALKRNSSANLERKYIISYIIN